MAPGLTSEKEKKIDEAEEAALQEAQDPDEPEDDLHSLLADLDSPENFMKVLDQDGDGKISVEEFSNKKGSDSAERKQAADVFKIADLNGDGFFDVEELTQVISELTEVDNKEQAKMEAEMPEFEKSLIDSFMAEQEEETKKGWPKPPEDEVEDDNGEGPEGNSDADGSAEGDQGEGGADESAEGSDAQESEPGNEEKTEEEKVAAEGLPEEYQKGYAHDEL